jgi:plasmid stabilization system protein ParE
VAAVTLPVVLSPEARAEFDAACDWYMAQAGHMGHVFIDQVNAVLHRIAGMPQMYPVVFGDVRKAVVRRFPYCVYYGTETSAIRVPAIFHSRRDPSIWRSRV